MSESPLPIILTQVCQYWSLVAQDTGALWAKITLCPTDTNRRLTARIRLQGRDSIRVLEPLRDRLALLETLSISVNVEDLEESTDLLPSRDATTPCNVFSSAPLLRQVVCDYHQWAFTVPFRPSVQGGVTRNGSCPPSHWCRSFALSSRLYGTPPRGPERLAIILGNAEPADEEPADVDRSSNIVSRSVPSITRLKLRNLGFFPTLEGFDRMQADSMTSLQKLLMCVPELYELGIYCDDGRPQSSDDVLQEFLGFIETNGHLIPHLRRLLLRVERLSIEQEYSASRLVSRTFRAGRRHGDGFFESPIQWGSDGLQRRHEHAESVLQNALDHSDSEASESGDSECSGAVEFNDSMSESGTGDVEIGDSMLELGTLSGSDVSESD
ncbi:hypothetical protein BDZ89DRAFT_1113221 [Hymenopellis radicata]|nr:hypothetical protein BDZ89DRAFT_1113221 [Hymenopellis radicata]